MNIRGKRVTQASARATLHEVQTVLLVEDEPEIVGLLTDFLADEGFGVVSAGDPPAAIDARHGLSAAALRGSSFTA